MLLSDFFYKVGWARTFTHHQEGLLSSILEKIHLFPECGEGVRGGALSNCAGGSIHWYKVHLGTWFRGLQDVHALWPSNSTCRDLSLGNSQIIGSYKASHCFEE